MPHPNDAHQIPGEWLTAVAMNGPAADLIAEKFNERVELNERGYCWLCARGRWLTESDVEELLAWERAR
jgi:hypothetical protein